VLRVPAKVVFVVALALGQTAALAGPAKAATLDCGDIVTTNTVLTNDVGPCGTGLVVGANNITLDLNQHTVSGNPAVGDGAGIFVLGRTGVTVKNGTVRSFDGGVIIEGGSKNRVTGIVARDNIGVVGTTKYADGIAILSSTDNAIVANAAIHNGPLSGIGVYTVNPGDHPRATSGVSTRNLIDANDVRDNNIQRNAGLNDDDGIRIETQSTFNTITNNNVAGSALDGIAIFSFAPDNTIKYNTSSNNGFLNPATRRGDGIRVFGGSDRTFVQGNIVMGNAANGIIFHGQFNARPPVLNSQALDNTALNNNVLPPLGPGPLGGPTFDLLDGNPTCDANVWLRNVYHTASPPCTTTAGSQV
jgi:hypothetical protein